MTSEQILLTLKANRELVIKFYDENCKVNHSRYTLKWFMEQVLSYAELSWGRRVNIGDKDILCQMKQVLKYNPSASKNYVSNWQKAVNYFGEEKAKQIYNAR